MAPPLFVLFTMDVDPRATAAGSSGPVCDEAGMRSIRDFQDVLRASGYRAMYFVHPELVEVIRHYGNTQGGGAREKSESPEKNHTEPNPGKKR